MNIKGKLLEIFPAQQVSTKFKKREFVVEYAENSQYPQYIKFELVQDKCDDIEGFSAGDVIDIAFDLKGRQWTNPKGEKVYFNTLNAWKIKKVGDGAEDNPKVDDFLPPETQPDDFPF